MKPQIYIVELIGSASLCVMAKPVSGEWVEDEFRAIADEGIDRIVSLLEASEEKDVGLEREGELCEKFGMKFISYPIPDRGLPESISDFAKFTKKLYHETAGGIVTVIHCRAGIGRTGIVAGGVLLHCGFEPDQAFEHISAKRGVTVPDTEEQINWLKQNYAAIVKYT